MDLGFYWNAFKHWFWVLLITVAVTLYGITYLERQRGRPWQGTVAVQVEGPFALGTNAYAANGVTDAVGQITPEFDFNSVANSFPVAERVIQDLHLPQDNPS